MRKIPEIRVVEDERGIPRRVTFVRDGAQDIDLTDLFDILEIRRVIGLNGIPTVSLDVLARLVEVEAPPVVEP